jgi:hypothetical protein
MKLEFVIHANSKEPGRIVAKDARREGIFVLCGRVDARMHIRFIILLFLLIGHKQCGEISAAIWKKPP